MQNLKNSLRVRLAECSRDRCVGWEVFDGFGVVGGLGGGQAIALIVITLMFDIL